jgi:uncharacterized protein (TIGR00255 family)
MTGFGSAEGMVGAAGVSVEIRTVNHRFFNPSIKLPGSFAKWEGDVREVLRQRIARGHVALTARVEREEGKGAGINEQRFREYVDAIRNLQQRYGLNESLDAATILSLPDVVDTHIEERESGSVAELVAIVDQAINALRQMRAEEGGRLAVFLLERISLVEEGVKRIRERAPIRLAEQVNRLKRSVKELVSGANVDQQRFSRTSSTLRRSSTDSTLTSDRSVSPSGKAVQSPLGSVSDFFCRKWYVKQTRPAARQTTPRYWRMWS